MKAVILAGGKGARLAPYTTVFPKPMLPVGNKPILEIIIRQLVYYGISDITLCVGYLAELIQAYFQSSHSIHKIVKLSYVREEEPLGTAGPIALVKNLKEPFLVMNGDILTTLDYSKLIDFHKKQNSFLTIGVHKKDVKMDLGIIDFAESGKVNGYIERPTYTYSDSMGIYVCQPEVLCYIKRDTYLDFPSLVNMSIKDGKDVLAYHHNESHYWIDMGRFGDYQTANEDFRKREVDFLPR